MVQQCNNWNVHEIPFKKYIYNVLADSFKGVQILEIENAIGI